MRQESRREYQLIIWFLMAAFLFVSGCTPRQAAAETMTLGSWIQKMQEEAGLAASKGAAPYYLQVPKDHPCYEAVQSAVEWGVLDPADGFDPAAPLTREWAAYTLSHLKDAEVPDVSESSIVDLARTSFPKEVKYAVRIGLFDLDEKGRFHPAKTMSTEAATAALRQVVEWMDAWMPQQTQAEIEWHDGKAPLLSEKFTLQEDGSWQDDQEYQEGDTVYSYPEDAYYRIENSGKAVEVEGEELFDDFDYSYSGELDLSDAQAEPLEQSFVPGGPSALVRTFSFEKWKVRTSVQSSGIRAELYKEYDSGGRTFAAFSLHHIQPVIHWKMRKGKLEDSTLKLSFTTTESIGAKISEKRYGDFTQLPNSLRTFLTEQRTVHETTIPLASLRIPLPQVPGLNLVLRVELKLGADGTAELVLTQNHTIGFEVRKGSMRSLNQSDSNVQASARANAWLTGGVSAALAMGKKRLADIGLHTGIQTQCKTTLHLYDSDHTHTTQTLSASSDLFQDTERQLVCADLNAELVLKAIFNSSSTLAGKFGFSKTIDFLDAKGTKAIASAIGHVESGNLVAHCTRGSRDTGIHRETVDDGAIRLEQYVLFLRCGETQSLPIRSLPSGISFSQLRFRSSSACVKVTGSGEISGIEEGSSIVTIESADGRYRAVCAIIVRGT